jgi:hypothetical protein
VVKFEMDQKNGSLANWEESVASSFIVTKSVNGKSTDHDCGPLNNPKRGECEIADDEPTFDDFNHHFELGSQFDTLFLITHGARNRLGVSHGDPDDSWFHPQVLMRGNKFRENIFKSRSFHPFFLLASCLAGNVIDDDDSFMNGLSGAGISGALAFSVESFFDLAPEKRTA